MPEYRLSMEHITKKFPGVMALDDVQLHVLPGTVHALMGENGAGKSTLMNCLFGIYRIDNGSIFLEGKDISYQTPQTALANGISMIHQELDYIPYQTVTDNLWVGRYLKKGLIVDEKLMTKKSSELLQKFGFDINPLTYARNLSISQLQALEIVKAVSCNAKVIIMDEPTSSLTIAESEHLFQIIRQLKADGKSIIYISHKLEEVFTISDYITIMRDGKYINTWKNGDISEESVIKEMVGRTMSNRFPPRLPKTAANDKPILEVRDFTSTNPHSFKNISFDLKQGEILGIGGLVGAQRSELVESVFGLRKIREGQLFLKGKRIVNNSPHDAIRNGFGLLTEERRTTGIIPMLSIRENTLLASWDDYTGKGDILKTGRIDSDSKSVCNSLRVKTPSMKTKIQNLSGGNQQKVLICRWLLKNCSILILDEPTRGIDVGAKYEIYKIMQEFVMNGKSIIMVSSEMTELIGMSDRIIVMCNGYLRGILNSEEATQENIMKRATQFN